MPLSNIAFNQMYATRKKFIPLQTMTNTGDGAQTLSQQLPRTGLLAGLYLDISVTIGGTLGAATAAGVGALISRVRLVNNNNLEIFNVSGLGYHHLLQQMLELERGGPVTISNQGGTVASLATFNLDMYIPVQMNMLDPLGVILLQNDQIQLTLNIDLASSTAASATGTMAFTIKPYMLFYTVPTNPALLPPLDVVHRISEDQTILTGTGEYRYNWQRGNTYLQLAHGLVLGHTSTNGISNVSLAVNQADYIYSQLPVEFWDVENQVIRGLARGAGRYIFDFMGNAGLGNFGATRDYLNSANATDIQSILTIASTGTLFTVRRELIKLAPTA